MTGELIGLESGVRAVVLHQAHITARTTSSGKGGQDGSGAEARLGGGDLYGILAGGVDVHFHPEGAAVQGPVRRVDGGNVGGNASGVFDEIDGPSVAGPVVEELETIGVPGEGVIAKNDTSKITAIYVFAHGNLHGSRPTRRLVIKKEVIGTVTSRALRNSRTACTPARGGNLVKGIGTRLPTKRKGGSGEVIGDRTLRNRITTILGNQSLLPEGRFGVLGVQIKAPFDALRSRIEIGPQLIVPDPIALGVIDTVIDPWWPAPNSRAAVITITGVGYGARTPFLDLVLVTINSGVITANTSTKSPVPQTGRTTAQP